MSVSRTHCSTGKRCTSDLALIKRLVSCEEARADLMVDLNWRSRCLVSVDSMVNHQPGIWPSPPTLEPTQRAPFLPNSTATSPNGSSREGIKANSAPLKTYGGICVNSGLEYTRPGYLSMIFCNFRAANLPWLSMGGPMQMSWTSLCLSMIPGKTSAMRSIPFWTDQRPTNTNS